MLGGATRVQREAPVAAVHSLSDGRLFLQLTESLPEGGLAARDAEAIARLESFLEPVCLPIGA